MAADNRRESSSVAAQPPVAEAGEPEPFHPDRDGCDCLKRGLMEIDECVHDDPCWVSRAAYESRHALSSGAKILRLAQGLRLLRDTGGEYVRSVATAALAEAGIADPPEEDHP